MRNVIFFFFAIIPVFAYGDDLYRKLASNQAQKVLVGDLELVPIGRSGYMVNGEYLGGLFYCTSITSTKAGVHCEMSEGPEVEIDAKGVLEYNTLIFSAGTAPALLDSRTLMRLRRYLKRGKIMHTKLFWPRVLTGKSNLQLSLSGNEIVAEVDRKHLACNAVYVTNSEVSCDDQILISF